MSDQRLQNVLAITKEEVVKGLEKVNGINRLAYNTVAREINSVGIDIIGAQKDMFCEIQKQNNTIASGNELVKIQTEKIVKCVESGEIPLTLEYAKNINTNSVFQNFVSKDILRSVGDIKKMIILSKKDACKKRGTEYQEFIDGLNDEDKALFGIETEDQGKSLATSLASGSGNKASNFTAHSPKEENLIEVVWGKFMQYFGDLFSVC